MLDPTRIDEGFDYMDIAPSIFQVQELLRVREELILRCCSAFHEFVMQLHDHGLKRIELVIRGDTNKLELDFSCFTHGDYCSQREHFDAWLSRPIINLDGLGQSTIHRSQVVWPFVPDALRSVSRRFRVSISEETCFCECSYPDCGMWDVCRIAGKQYLCVRHHQKYLAELRWLTSGDAPGWVYWQPLQILDDGRIRGKMGRSSLDLNERSSDPKRRLRNRINTARRPFRNPGEPIIAKTKNAPKMEKLLFDVYGEFRENKNTRQEIFVFPPEVVAELERVFNDIDSDNVEPMSLFPLFDFIMNNEEPA